jgi:type II secretory pathway component PulF
MDDHLPDFLELLGLFLKSGLSLKDGFERLHPFFKRNAPGLTYFMNQVMNDVQKGSSFLSAFQKNALFFQKSKLQEMIPYIEQADSYGTPLGASL